jgi:PadR family transcriptional regulator, regulatory protein AphA
MPMLKLPLNMEHALLGILRNEPMHAYEMHQRLDQARALGLVWHLKQSQLYALLARLEEAGYIASTTEVQGNRPPRKILQLTSQGHAAFERWLREPVAHGRDFRLEFLAKLFFATQHNPIVAQRLILDQQQVCQARLNELQHQAKLIQSTHQYEWLVLQFRISNLQAIQQWLEICQSTLTITS